LTGYRDGLLDRFANPALKHCTWQIAKDGSQKLPQRLLGTIRDRLATGQSFERAALGVAAWMRYATGMDEQRREIRVSDPLSDRLRSISDAACGVPARLVDGFLHLTEVFGDDLPTSEPLRAALVGHVTALFRHGARESVRRLVQGRQLT
jgi:fructuronate reductase